jgi:hypothetical protein
VGLSEELEGLRLASRRAVSIVIKASPPEFDALVDGLDDLLAEAFGVEASSQLAAVASEIAALEGAPSARWNAAQKKIAALQASLEEFGGALPDEVAAGAGRFLATAYRLGQSEVYQPIGWGDPSFAQADRDALAGLHASGLYWIGKRYGEALDQGKLLAEVQAMIEAGDGRQAGGRRLAAAFAGEISRSRSYWSGLAATVATRSRSFGALSAMEQAGASFYEFVNPLDERTSAVCRHLDGTIFPVKGGILLREKLLDLKDPEAWKAASPWPRLADVIDAGGSRRSPDELMAKGIAWPPLHFHCRSQITVRIWLPLAEEELDPLGSVDPAAPPPPGKPKKIKPAPTAPEPAGPPPWTPSLPSQLLPLGSFQGVGGKVVETSVSTRYRAWKSSIQLLGYTEAEADAAIKIEAMADAIIANDSAAVFAILAKHPPAVPFPGPFATWPPGGSAAFPGADAAMDALAKIPTFQGKDGPDEGAYDVLEAWLKDQGYKAEERDALMGLTKSITWGHPAAVSPDKDAATLALALQKFPPGAVLGHPDLPQNKLAALGSGAKLAQPIPDAAPPLASVNAPPGTAVPLPGGPVADVSGPDLTDASQIEAGPALTPATASWLPSQASAPHGSAEPSTWASWLGSEGYSELEASALAREVAALESTAAAAGTPAWPMISRYLRRSPPGSLAAVEASPPAFLSPTEFGARLQSFSGSLEASLEDGNAYQDLVTGSRWIVRRLKGGTDQARSEVAAMALYRSLGLEVPEVRLVQLPGGDLSVATRAWHAWDQGTSASDVQAAAGDHLARTMPVDAWLANWNVSGPSGTWIRHRKGPDGTISTLRVDAGGALRFRWTGAAKALGPSVAEIDTFRDGTAPVASALFASAKSDPSLMLPMMDRIGEITPDQIRKAIAPAGYSAAEAEELVGVLSARAADLRTRASLLRHQAAEDARLAAEAAARRIEEASARAARLEELRGRLSAGEIPRGVVVPVLDLQSAASHLEQRGSVTFGSDHGRVAEQVARARRYQWRSGREVIEEMNGQKVPTKPNLDHQGFMVYLTTTKTADADVLQGLARIGQVQSGVPFAPLKRIGFGRWGEDPGGASASWDPVLQIDGDLANGDLEILGTARAVSTANLRIEYSPHAAGLAAMQGKLRIFIKTPDAAAAQAELESVLGQLGLSGALEPPEDQAAELLNVNRILWSQEGPRVHRQRGVPTTIEEARRRLSALPPEVRADADRVTLTTIGEERYVAPVIPDRWRRYHKKGVRGLYHEGGHFSFSGVNGSGGLASTVERFAFEAAPALGASSRKDVETGGANGVFLRCVTNGPKDDWYEMFGPYRVIMHPRVLDRTDIYAAHQDVYGDFERHPVSGLDEVISRTVTGSVSTGHELMPRYRVPMDDFLIFTSSKPDTVQNMRDQLRAAGITKIRGYPLEEMVVEMRNQKDFSKLNPANPYHRILMDEDAPDAPMDVPFYDPAEDPFWRARAAAGLPGPMGAPLPPTAPAPPAKPKRTRKPTAKASSSSWTAWLLGRG